MLEVLVERFLCGLKSFIRIYDSFHPYCCQNLESMQRQKSEATRDQKLLEQTEWEIIKQRSFIPTGTGLKRKAVKNHMVTATPITYHLGIHQVWNHARDKPIDYQTHFLLGFLKFQSRRLCLTSGSDFDNVIAYKNDDQIWDVINIQDHK